MTIRQQPSKVIMPVTSHAGNSNTLAYYQQSHGEYHMQISSFIACMDAAVIFVTYPDAVWTHGS